MPKDALVRMRSPNATAKSEVGARKSAAAIARRSGQHDKNSENSKANRIETMKGPAESGQICSVGRRKIAK
jgi:hypothetical protein